MQTTTVTTEARCEALYSSLLSARAEEARLLAEYRTLRGAADDDWNGPGVEAARAAWDKAETASHKIVEALADEVRGAIAPMHEGGVRRLVFGQWEIRAVRVPGAGRGLYTIPGVLLLRGGELVTEAAAKDSTADAEACDEWRVRVG